MASNNMFFVPRIGGNGSSYKRDYAVATNYGSLQILMNGDKKFDIEMEEILFYIPIQANKFLSNAIKNSHELKITIQEDKFDENSWKILSKGIISRKFIGKRFVLQIQFTKISKANVHYFCNTITQAWTKELILHDLIFEEDTFDIFCSRIAKITYIHVFEMSTNNLTQDQVARIRSILEKKLGKGLKLYEAREKIAHSATQVAELSQGTDGFSIRSVEELTLPGSIKLTPNLCCAIKTSTSLKKITVVDYYADSDQWCNQWLIDAISTSRSITEICLDSEGPRFAQIIDIIAKIIANTGRIITFEVSDQLDITAEKAKYIYELLTNTKSIRNFKISAPYIHLATYRAIASAPYLSSLSITTTDWPSLPEHVLSIAQSISHVPKLTIRKGQMQPLVSKLELDSVKELRLKDANELTGGMKKFSTKVKESKTLESLSLNGCFNIAGMKRFRRIYKFNENLLKINFMSSPFDSPDLTKFIVGLKKNKTLTSVSFVLNADCTNQLAPLLSENTTLIHLGIVFDDELKETRRSIALALSTNTTLQSLSVKTTHALSSKILRKNNSISAFRLTCDFEPTNDIIRKFWNNIKIVLKHNSVLDTVVLKTNGVRSKTADFETVKWLETNKQTKKQSRLNITLFIRIMVARPQIYLSVLPLEIWSNIFKQISIPGVHVDFNKILLECFKGS